MIRKIRLCGQETEYDLQRKKVKNINLRIRSDGSVHVSAPSRVPLSVIESFMRSNEEYILRAIDRHLQSSSSAVSPAVYENGEKIRILGNDLFLTVSEGKRNFAEIVEDAVVLTVRDSSNVEKKRETVEKLLAEVCREAVLKACEKVYPSFEESIGEYPVVKFRKMHTKWGICRPTRKEITFSYMLAAVPEDCIEYVVYHEFCHFLHPNHSKSFYACLERFVPDWKNKKARLNGSYKA